MIVEMTKNDNDLMNSFDFLFSTIFSYKINDDFVNNSFTKYFIYLEKSNIIGFVNYYDLYERFEIANIYVLEDYRHKGIASSLITKVIDVGKQKNIENITLEVKKDNDAAIALYKKFDFLPVAVRSKYYNGVDGILMERMMK